MTEKQMGKMEVAELKMMRSEMGIEYFKKRQDKELVCERNGTNCKAGRQISGHKVTLVWTREEKKFMLGKE